MKMSRGSAMRGLDLTQTLTVTLFFYAHGSAPFLVALALSWQLPWRVSGMALPWHGIALRISNRTSTPCYACLVWVGSWVTFVQWSHGLTSYNTLI